MDLQRGDADEISGASVRGIYRERMQQVRAVLDTTGKDRAAGTRAIRARADAVDELVQATWSRVEPAGQSGLSLVAVGGYGRRELFPYSDVDLLILLDGRTSEAAVKEPLRALNQRLWDGGLRVSPMIRTLPECGRFDPENVEFTLALLDARLLCGDREAFGKLSDGVLTKLIQRERKAITARLLEVTRARHAKYGNTLFHLEPNVKECPGGLRDVHVCAWLARLQPELSAMDADLEFEQAHEFLQLVRAFLHLRHGRDDNTLDWVTQDEAAEASLGAPGATLDVSYWMRLYFRHARAVLRRTLQEVESVPAARSRFSGKEGRRAGLRLSPWGKNAAQHRGLEERQGTIALRESDGGEQGPECDPEIVLSAFALMAGSGVRLSRKSEVRIEGALPALSTNLEDGPALWRHLQAILLGRFAGSALRVMHALGLLELIIPEFHGIDALVIRDAYHRYTVDEHTFVLIDTLHALASVGKDKSRDASDLERWRSNFAQVLQDLPHPELLFLAALLHDTGKGRAGGHHARESVRLARSVLDRLELESYEAGMVLDLIANHLEMSAALRRDVFDSETIRSFAQRASTPEALRMLTLFTFADLAAVHPDALTPWKAENLWRLYLATSSFLDRNVDEERVAFTTDGELGDILYRVHAMLRERRVELAGFLEGLPVRYLQTRTPDHIRAQFEMAARLPEPQDPEGKQNQLDFRYAPGLSELTLVTRDRPGIFACMAGALAGWGMDVVTADAFSNAHGVVVDSFRFSDSFRTLELNDSERARFITSLEDVIEGRVDVDKLLAGRRRARRRSPKIAVPTRIDFDDTASRQSTLLQVVAQDTPGLLRALASTLAEHRCNIEVALVDTEGEMAIDVFYITEKGGRLERHSQDELRHALLDAIERNAR